MRKQGIGETFAATASRALKFQKGVIKSLPGFVPGGKGRGKNKNSFSACLLAKGRRLQRSPVPGPPGISIPFGGALKILESETGRSIGILWDLIVSGEILPPACIQGGRRADYSRGIRPLGPQGSPISPRSAKNKKHVASISGGRAFGNVVGWADHTSGELSTLIPGGQGFPGRGDSGLKTRSGRPLKLLPWQQHRSSRSNSDHECRRRPIFCAS